jgi:hypothetical protein
MKTLFFALAILGACFISPSHAQLGTISGKFFVSVDDAAAIMLNGTKIHQAGIGESSSPEVAIKAGDRLVVNLYNKEGPRRFVLAFLSTDHKKVVSFRNTDFKIAPGYELKDLSESEIRALPKTAKETQKKPHKFPFKHTSESLWGEDTNAVVACIVRPEIFKEAQ